MTLKLLARAEQLAAPYPPLLVEAERVAHSVWQGVHGRRRAGVGESFWQFRRYDTGDAADRIDWRQSARTDKLYVRVREWEAAQTVYLWADASGSMRYASRKNLATKAEAAQLLILALASLLLRGGEKPVWCDDAGFVSVSGKAGLENITNRMTGVIPLPSLREGLGVGQDVRHPSLISKVREGGLTPRPPSFPLRLRSRATADACFQTRRSFSEDGPHSGREALTANASYNNQQLLPLPQTRHAHMILASDFLMPPEALQKQMQSYAAQNLRGVLLHIIDPLEESFALNGRVELQGTEGEASLLLPNAEAMRAAYQQKFAEHESHLRRMAASAGWHYQRHITSDAPHATLLKLYESLAHQNT